MRLITSIIIFSLFFTSYSFAKRGYIDEFVQWLNDNELYDYLDKKKKAGPKYKDTMGKLQNFDWSECETIYKPTFCYDENGLITEEKRKEADKKLKYFYTNINFKIPDKHFDRIPWDANPTQAQLLYRVFHLIEDDIGWSKANTQPSKIPYKFEFNLVGENKLIKKKIQKTGLLSYLLFEDKKIKIDEITPIDKYGLLFKDDTKWTSASVGKSIVSYVTGQAICDGYIDNVDVKLNDWPLLKNTLYENVTLINLLNMAAGDQQLAQNNLKKGKGRERNPNVNTIEYHMKGIFKGTKPAKNKYNYSNLVPNIIINYVWFKSNGNFNQILDKVFKQKAKIKNDVFFLKQNFRTVRMKYPVSDESGPLRYSFRADRYDFLRIAKAMLEDWQNDTCVGKYLKQINERKISKNLKYKSNLTAYSYSRSYGGLFHLNFPGFKDRNIFGLDGAYGQSILIDMDESKIIVINAAHERYNWYKIALSALK